MKSKNVENQVAEILKVLGSAFRIKLLYAIGAGEACVCHLEAILHKRQAYISQHLTVLRDAGILETRREGKYIFYRVVNDRVFQLMVTAAAIKGLSAGLLHSLSDFGVHTDCSCPTCEPDFSNETVSE